MFRRSKSKEERRRKREAKKEEKKRKKMLKKLSKKQKQLLSDFEAGKVLQVDNDKDNKKHFDSIRQNG